MGSYSETDIASIREAAGDSLRVIAGYDQEGYDIQYIREDVEAKLPAVAEEIHEELVIQGIGQEYLEDLFQAGHSTVRSTASRRSRRFTSSTRRTRACS